MKAYFTAAIFQKDKFDDKYNQIVDILKSNDFEVFEDTTKVSYQEAIDKTDSERVDYYKRVLKWIDKSNLVVAEASFPSTLSIGHEITLASEKGKPVIVLYMKGRDPSFLLGLKSEKVIWVEYNDNNLKEVLTEALVKAKDQSDVRFNFFVSPKILNYLDWIAKKRMTPRSVFLRDLIEKEMKKDKEYKDN
ncbi:hypothetical protein A2574_03230 [Candidatus Shapirobacteria bacterium RIFOXYD1_FULL_38_32]|uniref:Nucleoside 2-deoxyribosyltransferase n=3 Tax=Candidatus Shapironibacteriota TaxID=1752721 RepID=A0A0G0MZ69_9BACT|nr:MAG: hypothetical protein US90_C0008G0053 [Candidatus Shapirobacteria bacterium GW2011_GWE2_38_30]KKQ90823.1 MAG: hypothetical protein UT14_C0028G0013 [Candidatus Shapirobacteria bacterium GW2011_GWE1_38_92]OGL55930.1 MAG: hypothetical protein A2367_02035 [Candidatus Shapirobacteria bacterium RIFOXYB1_FULL_38_38]OGL56690.1 MAG: hypothetical protein A2410_01450 [Candidatus Shapirobacteria bacterium RIFOXYC1_FULL_38_24]OGL57984.1 MAG: hypothetical protein A2574_03230 [Candidatus Shapirobacteri